MTEQTPVICDACATIATSPGNTVPHQHLQGQCRETFIQVLNKGFPAGLIGVDDTVKEMNRGCYKG